jgi:hypothetical protein
LVNLDHENFYDFAKEEKKVKMRFQVPWKKPSFGFALARCVGLIVM